MLSYKNLNILKNYMHIILTLILPLMNAKVVQLITFINLMVIYFKTIGYVFSNIHLENYLLEKQIEVN